ncbi:MAG: DegT/DnrJ/EryC1/StrS family aminotransferase [Candidatus Liptonbacteria bacterium]|nr:DegT/DnrJ/EryC1/StrS family aminotransferase [Candidatus Liptonbacteria bacterium]
MKVRFMDLSGPTQEIKKEFLARLDKFLDKANFILTDEVRDFENAWARYVGTEHCVGVSNGTDALWLALIALGVKAGDEVITQGNAYNASVTAILRSGAIPRFADIDPKTLLVDTSLIEQLITPKTRAILPVHLYGQASDMGAIVEIAKKHKLVVIEDCAQAHGAEWQGKRVGSWGDAAAWSFYPTKNLGALGDAGAVTTSNARAAEEIRILRNLGQSSKNVHARLGYNMRLDPIQAIALSLKLAHLSESTKKRQAAGAYYDGLIDAAKFPVQYVRRDDRATHVYHLYPVKILKALRSGSGQGDRDKVREELSRKDVGTEIHYPVLVMDQPFYPKDLLHDACPVATETARAIISLPLHENITKEEQKYVIDSLKEAVLNSNLNCNDH